MELWRPFIEEQAGGTLENLQEVLADQSAFARFTRQVMRACVINHRIARADMDYLLETVRDVAIRECGVQ